MDLAALRNLGIVAHIDAGKTTLSERILFVSGVEHRVGQVDEGTAVLDWMAEERERGITITAAATRLPWRGAAINLVDTPGHVDFTVEVERCMRVLDGAVLVVDAVAGVQAQSEAVWRQMARHGVPCVAFVNKCDRAGADFLAAVQSLRARLAAPAVPVQYPLLESGVLTGNVDLVTGRAFAYDPAGLEPPAERALPEELADEVGVLQAELFEVLAEDSEAILQALLEEREPPLELLQAELRRRTIARTLVPVLAGAALRHVGVELLLDAVVDWLPSPLDLPPMRGSDPKSGAALERAPDAAGPTAALAFKIQARAHADLTYVRLYSGRIEPGQALWNPRLEAFERVGRVLRMHADQRQQLDVAEAGDIVALTGLKQTGTGDTLCARDAAILFEPLAFPEPVITMMVEPQATVDRERLGQALKRLAREDPTLTAREDESTGQWAVAGMGELHLEVVRHRLESEFGIRTHVGQPRVAYREAPSRAGAGAGRIDRVLGGKEVFGELELELRPLEGAESLTVRWADGVPIPAAHRASVQETLIHAGQSGPRFGYPLVQAEVLVTGGASNPKKDSELAFDQAAGIALREAMLAAEVKLLEPVMDFEIEAPDEFASGILADLNARRAVVTDVALHGPLRVVHGSVPLAQMFGYSTVVRSLSQGRASFSMEPAGFREVPAQELSARGLVWT